MIFKKADDGYARESLAHFLDLLVDLAALVPAAPLVFSFMKQVILYLRKGLWVEFSGVDALSMVFTESSWLYSPRDWIGIHQFLEWVHGGVFASVLLLLLCMPLLVLLTIASAALAQTS